MTAELSSSKGRRENQALKQALQAMFSYTRYVVPFRSQTTKPLRSTSDYE
jgi:hypothetical protein